MKTLMNLLRLFHQSRCAHQDVVEVVIFRTEFAEVWSACSCARCGKRFD